MINKKRIWIFNHYAVAPYMPGGTRHYDLAKQLITKGYEVIIFASSYNHQKLKEFKFLGANKIKYIIENKDGVIFIWIKTIPYKKNDYRRFLNMLSYMYNVVIIARQLVYNKIIKKPNVIIGSSVHLFAGLSAYYLSKIFNCKFILEIRDLWPKTLIDHGKLKEGHPLVLMLKLLELFLYKRAKKIITLLENSADYFCSYGIEINKIVFIPNGVNLDNYNFNSRKKNNLNSFNIFYIGGISETDNLFVLLRAAKKISEMGLAIKFNVVGDGMEKEKLIKYAKENNLNDIVIFKSSVPKSQIPYILNEADVLYVSMHNSAIYKYGISFNKLFEYMASGKPIIMYGNPKNNPLEITKSGIYVTSEDNLVQAILKLYYMDPKERNKFGSLGKEYVLKYHNISRLADTLERVILEVCR